MVCWLFAMAAFIPFQSIKAAEASNNHGFVLSQQAYPISSKGGINHRNASFPGSNTKLKDVRVYDVYNYQFYVKNVGICADFDPSTPKPCFGRFNDGKKQIDILFESVQNKKNKKTIKSTIPDDGPIKINCCITCIRKIMHSQLSTEDSKTKERRKIICYLGFIMFLENPNFKPSKPLPYRDFSNVDLIDFLENLKLKEIDYRLVAVRLVSYRFGVFHKPLLNYFFNLTMIYENLRDKYEESPSEEEKGSKKSTNTDYERKYENGKKSKLSQNSNDERKLKKRLITTQEELFESHLFDLARSHVKEYPGIEIYFGDNKSNKLKPELFQNFFKQGYSVFIYYLVVHWNLKARILKTKPVLHQFNNYVKSFSKLEFWARNMKNGFGFEAHLENKRCELAEDGCEWDFDVTEIDCKEEKKEDWNAYRINNEMPDKSALKSKVNYYLGNNDFKAFVENIYNQKILDSQNCNPEGTRA